MALISQENNRVNVPELDALQTANLNFKLATVNKKPSSQISRKNPLLTHSEARTPRQKLKIRSSNCLAIDLRY